MSGVLQRLATRVLAAPGAVRPRLGSRFEGFSGSAGRDAAEPDPGPTPPAPDAVPPAVGPGLAQVRRPSDASVSTPASAQVSGDRWARPEGQAAPVPLLPAAVEGTDSAPAADMRAAPGRSLMPSPVADGMDDRPPGEFRAEPARPVGSPPPAAAKHPRDRPLEAPQAPSRDRLLPADEARAATARRPEAPLLSPRPPDAASHAAFAPTVAAPPPEAPDIQVSIGRIEIRADHAAVRPPRRAPPRPSLMSLEDYLGKGRGRR